MRGNLRRYSDLDLVAFVRREQSAKASDLREAFEESDLPIRVDLFVWAELPDSHRKQIRQLHSVLQRASENALAVPG